MPPTPPITAREALRAGVRLQGRYTSSVIAESKSLSQGLLLAGEKPQWRNRPRFVAASVKKVIALYDKYHRDKSVVLHNLLLSSRLLQKAKEQSLAIFR